MPDFTPQPAGQAGLQQRKTAGRLVQQQQQQQVKTQQEQSQRPPSQQQQQVDRQSDVQTASQTPAVDWLDPATWPGMYKLLPGLALVLCLIAAFIANYIDGLESDYEIDVSTMATCAASFNYSGPINPMLHEVKRLSVRGEEVAMTFDALSQIRAYERTVFAENPFPDDKVPWLGLATDVSVDWVKDYLDIPSQSTSLEAYSRDLTLEALGATEFSNVSLGEAAIVASQRRFSQGYVTFAQDQKEILLEQLARHANGAIGRIASTRDQQPAMTVHAQDLNQFAPFLAYYGVAKNDTALLREAVQQCRLYRDVLSITRGAAKGLWRRSIVSPLSAAITTTGDNDDGSWTLGNALAAYSMLRVYAIIDRWAPSSTALANEKASLFQWIAEILDAAIATATIIENGKITLMSNYLFQKPTTPGETSGTALLGAIAYRMAMLQNASDPVAAQRYVTFAHSARHILAQHVDRLGHVSPAVDPLDPRPEAAISVDAKESFNALGESAFLLMTVAWRDCVCTKNPFCIAQYTAETGEVRSQPLPPSDHSISLPT